MTARKMVMATEKVEYLVSEMNLGRIKVLGEEEPGWTVVEITIDTPCDVIDIFYAGMRCGLKRSQTESYI